MGAEHMQIGEVAARTGLSLRTIRYYGEVGLARPSARSQGGFRLYTEDDVQRLLLIKRMKPLDFSLEEIGELVEALDRLSAGVEEDRERCALLERIQGYRSAAEARSAELRAQLEACEDFAARLGAVHAEHHESA
ncbi:MULTISPECIES: MerR family transcriptional regulator [Nocardiopsis]|uniref:MerR family transcriptional regulator n=1 Tax=Nocardiopsis TaxID=2013 RepID=UPI00034B9397|nr:MULTISPECIES: MerR family transcriptional regulator [Nocardiopsis]